MHQSLIKNRTTQRNPSFHMRRATTKNQRKSGDRLQITAELIVRILQQRAFPSSHLPIQQNASKALGPTLAPETGDG